MSDIGALSHVYSELNAQLKNLNHWVLSIRKAKDGYETPVETPIPADIELLLKNVAETINPRSGRATAAIPLSVRQKLFERLDDVDAASQQLYSLLQTSSADVKGLTEKDINLLNIIVASLDDEVTSLYSRMHRR